VLTGRRRRAHSAVREMWWKHLLSGLLAVRRVRLLLRRIVRGLLVVWVRRWVLRALHLGSGMGRRRNRLASPGLRRDRSEATHKHDHGAGAQGRHPDPFPPSGGPFSVDGHNEIMPEVACPWELILSPPPSSPVYHAGQMPDRPKWRYRGRHGPCPQTMRPRTG